MDLQQVLNLLLRIIGNSKKIPQLSEIFSLNGRDYFLIHSDELGKGVRIAAENALVPVDLIVREDAKTNFPMPGNNNKIYIATVENALYHWDEFLGDYVQIAGDKNFVHDQGTSATVWGPIQHNLNKYPSVTVFDTAKTECEGVAEYHDLNSLSIHFNSPFSGTATLN